MKHSISMSTISICGRTTTTKIENLIGLGTLKERFNKANGSLGPGLNVRKKCHNQVPFIILHLVVPFLPFVGERSVSEDLLRVCSAGVRLHTKGNGTDSEWKRRLQESGAGSLRTV